MPSVADPNLGLNYGWTLGESAWQTGMDANIRKLGALAKASVIDRDLTTPPASPVNGDRYIIPAGATGVWTGFTNRIAVRVAGVWEYYVPSVGWLCYIEDEQKIVVFKAAGWSPGVLTLSVQSLPYAATLGAHDASNGERISVAALTAAIIIPAPTNPVLGQKLTYMFLQNATGGFGITWNPAFKKAADPAAGGANTVACTEFVRNAANWVQQGGALAWFT